MKQRYEIYPVKGKMDTQKQLNVPLERARPGQRGPERQQRRARGPRQRPARAAGEEVRNTPFCPLQEKFHTFVLRGLRNISEAP